MINPSLVLVQPRKTRPFITERLLMGRKEQTKKNPGTIGMSIRWEEGVCRGWGEVVESLDSYKFIGKKHVHNDNRKLISYFPLLTYVVGAQKNRLIETVLLSTQNIC